MAPQEHLSTQELDIITNELKEDFFNVLLDDDQVLINY